MERGKFTSLVSVETMTEVCVFFVLSEQMAELCYCFGKTNTFVRLVDTETWNAWFAMRALALCAAIHADTRSVVYHV